ncbi:MAG: hypothetical protein IT200_12700 [Thermoleophilia bacterium]|nr:hypothetical protein [Thermoleophilia bacterium]
MTSPPDPPVTPDDPDAPDQEIGPFSREDVVDGFRGIADILEGPGADHLTAGDWNTLALLTIAANTMVESAPAADAPATAGFAAGGATARAFAMGRRRPPYRSVRVR